MIFLKRTIKHSESYLKSKLINNTSYNEDFIVKLKLTINNKHL